MRGLRMARVMVPTGALLLGLSLLGAAQEKAKSVWTSTNDTTLPADFKVQGEYAGEAPGGGKLGCQVIALGNKAFQAVVYPGGLPGAGWDGKNRGLMDGRLDGDKATFQPAAGKRRYLGRKPEEFSATSKFPPAGHREYHATVSPGGMAMSIQTDDGKSCELKKTVRESPTMGKPPPEGAVVLFDGTNKDEWRGGRVDRETKALNTDGSDMVTRRKFNNYVMHLEFLLPYRPDARGQERGNSGFYQVDHYEVQVLDSFGLEGKNNECGGVYTRADPKVNLCYPPLVWQTYDVEFTNAVREGDRKVKNARLTLRHNGVVVHDDIEISGPTGGNRNDPEGTPGPIKLQGHGNPLQYRNIWIVEKK